VGLPLIMRVSSSLPSPFSFPSVMTQIDILSLWCGLFTAALPSTLGKPDPSPFFLLPLFKFHIPPSPSPPLNSSIFFFLPFLSSISEPPPPFPHPHKIFHIFSERSCLFFLEDGNRPPLLKKDVLFKTIPPTNGDPPLFPSSWVSTEGDAISFFFLLCAGPDHGSSLKLSERQLVLFIPSPHMIHSSKPSREESN